MRDELLLTMPRHIECTCSCRIRMMDRIITDRTDRTCAREVTEIRQTTCIPVAPGTQA